MTYVFSLFGRREEMAYFEPWFSSELMQNEDIWNFHGSLTLNKGKLFDILEAFGMPLCPI